MHPAWPQFARRSNSLPFVWGVNDCMLDVADWAFEVTGLDLASQYRGTYSDPEACRALFRSSGGIVPVLRRKARSVLLCETDSPKPGDIGLVRAYPFIIRLRRKVMLPMGGILMPSGRWRVRTHEGHITELFPVIVAWSLSPCQC